MIGIFPLADLTENLGQLISDHWAKVVFLLIGAGLSLAWKYFWDRRQWRKRQGVETLHLSINSIQVRDSQVTRSNDQGVEVTESIKQPWLFLDCIYEDNLSNRVSNRYVRQLIRRAVSRTTAQQPFLHFGESADDHWYVMNMLRMSIAEIKGGDSLEKLGDSSRFHVIDVQCVFAATYERWPGMRQGKIRLMLARESDITQDRFRQTFQFEDPHHIERPKTLTRMSEDYNGDQKYTMMVRIPIRETSPA